METGPTITLEEGLDLREVQSTGSVIHINPIYDEVDDGTVCDETGTKIMDIMGEPIKDFKVLAKKMTDIDLNGFVKKLILQEGGGMPIGEDCTVSVAFSAYWENENEPFDVMTMKKPLEVDLRDNGILPGLEMAIKTMLVGELSLFLLSHEVMYGELGIPPRIKPAAHCVFYIKLLRSVLTPEQGKLVLSEPNVFKRVHKEVLLLYGSGSTLYKAMNLSLATNCFRKAVAMLHKCRLADEEEEKVQEKLLKKLYMNLALCYNKLKQPLKACVACNELNRLNSLWTSGKALFQNAKALRMIGQYNSAEKRLKRAMNLFPENKEMKDEMKLLISTRDSCNQSKLLNNMILDPGRETISEKFKEEVDSLIKSFKENDNLCKLVLPPSLNADEMDYVRQACIKENLFFNKISRNDAMNNPRKEHLNSNEVSPSISEETLGHDFAMDKEDEQSVCDFKSAPSELTLDEEILRQIALLVKAPQIISSK